MGQQVLLHLKTANATSSTRSGLSSRELDAISQALLDSYDWGYGGWGGAQKFPQPMVIEFLLRRAVTGASEREKAMKTALHALKAMARGGMYDVVGGGFSRYSTDNFWRVPHFEKMLYDNAQLARAYLHAWQITRDPFYQRVVINSLGFVQREMTNEEGGFYSSLDADSEGQEGKFYVWTQDQIRATLVDDMDFELFAEAYGVSEKGNWEGNTVLQRVLDDASLAARFKMSEEQVLAKIEQCHRKLLSERARRVRPGTDDKVLTAWNGLMLRTFAEAARFIGDAKLSTSYHAIATRNASFLLGSMYRGGQLCRSWREGNLGSSAFLEDYSALTCGLLELYQVDFEERWFEAAERLANEMITRFEDTEGGFFDTPTGKQGLLFRPKDLQDNATPSGNALACEALLRLAALTDRGDYRDRAERVLQLVTEPIQRFPTAFGQWLNTASFGIGEVKQIAIVYPGRMQDALALLRVVNATYRPNTVLAGSAYPPSNKTPALLRDRTLNNGEATAYVCEHFVCLLPVNAPDDLRRLL